MDLHLMSRLQLLQVCKDIDITRPYLLKKEDMIVKIKEYQTTQRLPDFLQQLLRSIQTDMKRKVCKQCGELDHNVTSIKCIMNADQNKRYIESIKEYFLAQELSKDNCLHFDVLSKQLNITVEQCKLLYSEIPQIEWIKRPIDLRKQMKELTFQSCQECGKIVCMVQCNTVHTWKEKKICDTCYSQYAEEREEIWKQIYAYRKIECALCLSVKKHKDERYHFDHINMFDKETGIYSMVADGKNMEDIQKEIDKCQVLCISCHHMVTLIERRTGFLKLKRGYTSDYLKQLENEELNRVLKENYHKIMTPIYVEMRQILSEIKETIEFAEQKFTNNLECESIAE